LFNALSGLDNILKKIILSEVAERIIF